MERPFTFTINGESRNLQNRRRSPQESPGIGVGGVADLPNINKWCGLIGCWCDDVADLIDDDWDVCDLECEWCPDCEDY